ncbi:MAG: hypothetical protein ABL898_17320, partial [Hyphomicrobiaceae bacterium]
MQRALTTTRFAAPSFLDSLEIQHGPSPLLGLFFATAYRAARDQGLELSLIGLDELAALNKAQRENWLPIVPTLSPASGHIEPRHAFAIVA